jgi:hypothetical protein
MAHGEELALSFSAAGLPPLPEGTKRTFLLYANGYEKGLELHSTSSRTVEPLPWRGMESYPYPPEKRCLDGEEIEYLLEWNTRPSSLRPPRQPTASTGLR